MSRVKKNGDTVPRLTDGSITDRILRYPRKDCIDQVSGAIGEAKTFEELRDILKYMVKYKIIHINDQKVKDLYLNSLDSLPEEEE